MSDLDEALEWADQLDKHMMTSRRLVHVQCLATEVRRLQAQKHLDDQTYAALKAELAALKDGGKRLLTKLCNESRRAEKAESDLAALKKRMAHDEACSECPLKYDLGRAGEIIKVHESQVIGLEADLAAAKAKQEEIAIRLEKLTGIGSDGSLNMDDQTYVALKTELAKSESEVRGLLAELAASCDGCDAESDLAAAKAEILAWELKNAKNIGLYEADLSQARAECADLRNKCARLHGVIQGFMVGLAESTEPIDREAAEEAASRAICRQIAEARRPLDAPKK